MKKTLFFISSSLLILFFYIKFKNDIPDNIPQRENLTLKKVENIQKPNIIEKNKIELLKIDNKKIKRGRDLSRNSITNKQKQRAYNSRYFKKKMAISNMIDKIEKEKYHEK
ncbi:hypothetical protein ThvES_00007050 [Thiovulum sp. ES]|nr:hypothetical protein ThvES_00007050 [Thiovulum sp. ES]